MVPIWLLTCTAANLRVGALTRHYFPSKVILMHSSVLFLIQERRRHHMPNATPSKVSKGKSAGKRYSDDPPSDVGCMFQHGKSL